jgi:hypothetical protein
VPFQGELKELSEREYNKLKKSITENGLIVPFFVWSETGKLLDGHQRLRVFTREGWVMDVPVVYVSAVDELDAKRKLLVISSQYGKVTQEGWDAFTFDIPEPWIQETVQFDALPFVFGEWEELGGGQDETPEAAAEEARQTLAERFVVPPFSVLDARQGYWQDRKRAWLALGIQSELGRGENALDISATMAGITDEKERAAWNKRRRESPRHTLGAIAPNEGGENGILASPGKYASGKQGGVKMALHNDPMQRKDKYDGKG